MTYEQIDELVTKQGLTLTDLIDYVIEKNGIIGVGVYTFADGIADYIRDANKRRKAVKA